MNTTGLAGYNALLIEEVAYNAIEDTADGSYVIIGTHYSTDVPGHKGACDGRIMKLDSNLNLVWQKSYGGSNRDYLVSLVQTTDGHYVGVGMTLSVDGDVSERIGGSGEDIWVIKVDRNDGTPIWDKCYGGTGQEQVSARAYGWHSVNYAVATQNGGFAFICDSRSTNGVFSGKGTKAYIVQK